MGSKPKFFANNAGIIDNNDSNDSLNDLSFLSDRRTEEELKTRNEQMEASAKIKIENKLRSKFNQILDQNEKNQKKIFYSNLGGKMFKPIKSLRY